MLVSKINQTPGITLKVVADQIKQSLADTQLQAVDFSDVTDTAIRNPALEALKPFADKFTITFSYKQHLHRTKVNVSGTNYGTPIYKVALSSRLSNESRVCWLQNTAEGWVTLLGDTLDIKLVKAITSAIEDQQ